MPAGFSATECFYWRLVGILSDAPGKHKRRTEEEHGLACERAAVHPGFGPRKPSLRKAHDTVEKHPKSEEKER